MARRLVIIMLVLAACQNGAAPSRSQRTDALAGWVLSLEAAEGLDETDQRPLHRVVLNRPGSEPIIVAEGVLDAALAPDGQVAWLDAQGVHVLAAGARRFVARAAPHGIAVGTTGVLFNAAAQRGAGAGLAFATWEGTVRTLVPAPEDLPGPAGYHHPALSPDGRYALAFSDLTARPSLWRVTITTGELVQLAGDMPGASERPSWEDGRLRWSDGEGLIVRVDPAAGTMELTEAQR
jgi:hypothetical protein